MDSKNIFNFFTSNGSLEERKRQREGQLEMFRISAKASFVDRRSDERLDCTISFLTFCEGGKRRDSGHYLELFGYVLG